MNVKAAVETTALAASAPVTLATAGVGQTLISLGVGLIGVWLARTVFVNRENRRLDQPLPWSESLPITLAACLIAGAIIYDQSLGISASAFLGLGVGWTTVVILEFAGDRVINALRAMFGLGPIEHGRPDNPPVAREIHPNLPPDMQQLLHKADDVAPDYRPPPK